MTANADMPDAVGEGRHPYGPCYHTKYEGCPPCVHSAWDEGVQAAREAVAASVHYELCICDECLGRLSALDAIDALRGDA